MYNYKFVKCRVAITDINLFFFHIEKQQRTQTSAKVEKVLNKMEKNH